MLQSKNISDLNKSIDAALVEIDVMCEEGLVNMAVNEYFKVRQKKQEKEERERDLKSLSDTGGPSGHQKLQVCDVCGAYLSRLDNDRRLADHFYGKMHLGYAQMRKSYNALKTELAGQHPPPRSNFGMNYDGGRRDGYGGGGYGGNSGWGGGGGGRRGRGRGGRGRGRGGY